jgi:RimJ/RimL family protein N-acetyltransferase
MEPSLPQPFESERLVIRAPRLEDAEALVEAIAETHEELRPWMPWAQQVPSLDAQRAHLREARRLFEAGEDIPLYLVSTTNARVVGGRGLHRSDWSVPRFEIGYWVRTACARQGFATEAVRAIAAAAFAALGARRVEIRCSDANERSWRVAERAGFVLEGVLRHEGRHPGGSLRDTRVYALVR